MRKEGNLGFVNSFFPLSYSSFLPPFFSFSSFSSFILPPKFIVVSFPFPATLVFLPRFFICRFLSSVFLLLSFTSHFSSSLLRSFILPVYILYWIPSFSLSVFGAFSSFFCPTKFLLSPLSFRSLLAFKVMHFSTFCGTEVDSSSALIYWTCRAVPCRAVCVWKSLKSTSPWCAITVLDLRLFGANINYLESVKPNRLLDEKLDR